MNLRTLGRTNLRVGPIALGTVELGLDYGIPDGRHTRPDAGAATRLLHAALERGVNLIDTARAYGDAEAVIGAALADRRDKAVLVTKANLPRQGEVALATVRPVMRGALETSLRLLRTDCVDVWMYHSAPWDWHARDEVLAEFEAARAAGKARWLGVSVYGADNALDAIREGGWDCMQIAVNALDRQMEHEVLPLARARNIGIVARSVLLKGALSERARALPGEMAALRDAALALAGAAGVPLAGLPEAAYRYVLALDGICSVLVGTAHLDELDAALGYAALPAPDAATLARMRAVVCAEPKWFNPGNWPAM